MATKLEASGTSRSADSSTKPAETEAASPQRVTLKLKEFTKSGAFQALPRKEQDFLLNYSKLREKAFETISSEDLCACTGYTDKDRVGSGTINHIVDKNYLDGIELCNLLTQKPFLLIHRRNGEFVLIRNDDIGNTKLEPQHLSIFNLEKGKFEPMQADRFLSLTGSFDESTYAYIEGTGELSGEDLMQLFNSDKTEAYDKIPEKNPVQSPHPVKAEELFYHQGQHMGMCCLHAANAFIGGPFVKPSEMDAFYKAHDATDDGAVEGLPAGTFNLDDGIDFTQVIPFVKNIDLPIDVSKMSTGAVKLVKDDDPLVTDHIIYEHPTKGPIELTPEFFAGKDRILFTPRVNHCEALRLNTAGQWVQVDSESVAQPVVDPIAHIREKLEAAGTPLQFACIDDADIA
ncbi:MAG: hypothetical protein S4CHLAM37_02460 [Chlamydiia bacterium]|nr:hypothetical protein [Chlamydiia bacterium]